MASQSGERSASDPPSTAGRFERSRIAALKRYGILDTAPDPRFDRLTHLATALFAVPMALVTLIDQERQWFKSRVGLSLPETARAIAFCNTTITRAGVTIVEDAAADPTFAGNPLVTGDPFIRFYAGAPLCSSDGYAIGTLAILDTRARRLDDRETRLLLELAAIAVDELELWRRVGSTEENQRQERERFEEARAMTERRFAALIENAPDVIVLLDATGRALYASPALEDATGWQPDELVGRNVVEALIHPDEAEDARRELARVLERPGALIPVERRTRHRDGSWRILAGTAQNLLDDPAVRAIVLNARDITRRRAAEDADARARQELAHTTERLRQAEKMEALGRLAGGIAHDFNNVLTVILNSAASAQGEAAPGSELAADLQQIVSASERAAALTKQILAFSRRQVLSRGSADVRLVLDDVLRLVRPLLGDAVTVTVAGGEELGPIEIDRAQLERVLLNLFVNARDAMPAGGAISVKLRRSAAPPGRDVPGTFVVLTVEDTGVGMPPDVMDRAFEPFFTTKASGEGTGLGLSIVHGVVEQHGGFVEVESTPGAGSRFHVYLPDQRSAAAGAPSDPAAAPEPARGEMVLVAEDDALVRLTTVTTLKRAGYRVIEAADGEEAVARFRERSAEIALVLLDSIMPKLGGAEALARIRALRPDVRFLMCSGYPQAFDDVQTDDWLAKPYRTQHLLARVRERLR